jgi:hypothetical protein
MLPRRCSKLHPPFCPASINITSSVDRFIYGGSNSDAILFSKSPTISPYLKLVIWKR